MSVPERKTLREVLPKLKSKAMESEMLFSRTAHSILLKHSEVIEGMKKIVEKSGDSVDYAILTQLSIEQTEQSRTKLLIANATSVINDLKIYIEFLEMLSSELDKAFWKDIEKASEKIKRQIEQRAEQDKQDYEILKRKHPEKYIK